MVPDGNAGTVTWTRSIWDVGADVDTDIRGKEKKSNVWADIILIKYESDYPILQGRVYGVARGGMGHPCNLTGHLRCHPI